MSALSSPPPPGPPDDDDLPEPPRIRALRRLVTLLTTTVILGVVVVAATLVIRLSKPLTPLPDPTGLLAQAQATAVALPAGETATAAALTPGALTVLTVDADGGQRLRLFDPADGAPGPVIAITSAP